MYTNIKNLPKGNYFTEIGYSQSYPWVEMKRTAKTVTLARVNTVIDPEWASKIEFIPGGFCGHVPNQDDQTWLFGGVDHGRTLVIRKTKSGWSHKNVRFLEDSAHYFYDYNF